MGKLVTLHRIAITWWIFLIKAKIHRLNLQLWQLHQQPRSMVSWFRYFRPSHTNLNNLSTPSQYKGAEQVTVENGQALPINNIGNSSIHTKYHKFILRNVLYVPRIAMNLLSVHKFCVQNNCSYHFDANEFKIHDILTGRLLYRGLSENGVYLIYSKLQSKLPSFPHPSITSVQFAS